MNDNREGTETEKWEAQFEQNANAWYICDSEGNPVFDLMMLEREAKAVIRAHNESLARLQQPKEQGLEDNSSEKKEALSDHNARPTDGAYWSEDKPNHWLLRLRNNEKRNVVAEVRRSVVTPDKWAWDRWPWMGEWGLADTPDEAKELAEKPWRHLLSENGGETSKATGVSSPIPSPSCENCLVLQQQLQKKEEALSQIFDIAISENQLMMRGGRAVVEDIRDILKALGNKTADVSAEAKGFDFRKECGCRWCRRYLAENPEPAAIATPAPKQDGLQTDLGEKEA